MGAVRALERELGLAAAVGRGWGVFAPDPGASPGAGGGEVDVDGDLFGDGFEELAEAVAELGDGVGEGEEAGGDGVAGEVEGVAGGVEVAFEDSGLLAAEGERDGEEIEACWEGRMGWAAGARGGAAAGGGGCRCGAEEEIVEGDGVGAERGEVERLAGEFEVGGPGGMREVGVLQSAARDGTAGAGVDFRWPRTGWAVGDWADGSAGAPGDGVGGGWRSPCQARVPARVPLPVRPVGGWGVATPSQSKKVAAGRAGRVRTA